MFQLPSVMSRECNEVFLPRKSAFPMSNMRWIEMQMAKGQGADYWVNKIFDSEDFFSQQLDLSPIVGSIVDTGCAVDSFKPDEESWITMFTSAKFGLLTGMFERASNATKEKDCHPLTWNALSFLNHSIADELKKPFGDEHQILLRYMPYAGYLMGKIEKADSQEIFSQWHN